MVKSLWPCFWPTLQSLCTAVMTLWTLDMQRYRETSLLVNVTQECKISSILVDGVFIF